MLFLTLAILSSAMVSIVMRVSSDRVSGNLTMLAVNYLICSVVGAGYAKFSLWQPQTDGFFLMVESAIIDGYGHNNDSEGMIVEMREVDSTVRQLVEYVNQHPETLLVITADHETGGTGVDYNSLAPGDVKPVRLSFSTHGHTGTLVPIFAYGAGAEAFGGVMKNTDLPKKIEELMK